MSNAIFVENKKFISQWISLNPNFKGLEYENNILKYKEIEIDLNSFLVSELLNNDYFSYNIYTMKINEFLKIIKLHVEANLIVNSKEEKNTEDINEYIKYIKINSHGSTIIMTNEETIEIADISANIVLSKYSALTLKYKQYVPLNELLKSLHKEEKKKDSKIISIYFFELLQKDGELKLSDINHIKYISNFIFTLNDNEYMLVDKAKYLLNLYMIEMNKLKHTGTSTQAQEYALKLFDEYVDFLETEIKKNEESRALNSSQNYGYSSISLIITSILATGFVLLYFIICN